MLHITFSKYDCIIVHKAYYLFTCTCVSINSFHSHSHSHIYLNYTYDIRILITEVITLCIIHEVNQPQGGHHHNSLELAM